MWRRMREIELESIRVNEGKRQARTVAGVAGTKAGELSVKSLCSLAVGKLEARG